MPINRINDSIKNIKKKGGINIKKVFLMILYILININLLNVKATSANFYEAEYIDGIYMNKYQYKTKTIYYQKARFFRKSDTNEFAYCIEPFNFFNESSTYNSIITPTNLNKAQIDRITKIAYYGYGYKNHTDNKWYAITQLMIWECADKEGEYYFTDSLNGKRINIFNDEINEINNLINEHNKIPAFEKNNYNIIENQELEIIDKNNIIKQYIPNNNDIKIEENKVIISNLKEGKYNFSFKKEYKNYNKPLIFFNSNTSQDLLITGDLETNKIDININVYKTSLNIIKIDNDTESIIPQGEAKLDGAIYNILDENKHIIEKLTIENNQATISNLKFGKYYIEEEKAGIGYNKDQNIYEINISKENTNIDLYLKNKVIEKKIIIEKKYGETNNMLNEQDIIFNIYNNNNEKIKSIKTNELGLAEITLPYGKYIIEQINTTNGYTKIEPFEINVEDNNEELIELKDYKIKVPNTHTNSTFYILIKYLLNIFQ